MEPYNRFFKYVEQANKLVYDYYSVHSFACICYYYNLNSAQSIIEDEKLDGGSYEFYGNRSGLRYTKILFLPVFFVEPIQPSYVGEERGYIHETETSLVFPSSYNLVPYEHDIVFFPSNLNMNVNYPVYEVVGIEKATDTPITMYRLRVRSARTSLSVIDQQVADLRVWFEPEKRIVDHMLGLYLYKQLSAIDDILNKVKDNIHVTGIFLS